MLLISSLDFYCKKMYNLNMRTIYIENEKNNQTLISYIKNTYPSLSSNMLFKALRNKDIKVNNKRVSSDISLNLNDKLDIYISDNFLFNLPKSTNIIYEDENILVVYKPQGILSNIEDYDEKDIKKIGGFEPTLETLIKNINPKYNICHRLDRNTAGLVIFSKNDMSYNELINAFKEGYIIKEYLAYVSNYKFTKKHDILEKYILKDNDGYSKIYDTKIKNSQKIITEYNVESVNKDLDYAILKVLIHTGKTHQIRAQLANISHPIIGDLKYGKNEINKKFKIYKQLLFAINYSFNFLESSPLYYLNEKNITLDKSYYENKIR